MHNPFDDTKASYFSPDQILDLWVDPEPGVQLLHHFHPTGSMPMYIRGGKGCGKTHLMRRCSFEVQRKRMTMPLADEIRRSGYLGIWIPLNGLNTGRFSQDERASPLWQSLFECYVEFWFAQRMLETFGDAFEGTPVLSQSESAVVLRIVELFGRPPRGVARMDGLRQHLRDQQREVDTAVNTYAVSGELTVDEGVMSTPRGSLIFGIPKILGECFESLNAVRFVYLVDELENLTEAQQSYVATLVRHLEPPSTFRIGVRRYGERTHRTHSAAEENKPGAEFHHYDIDEEFRRERNGYENFARHLCAKRLLAKQVVRDDDLSAVAASLDAFFVDLPRTRLGDEEASLVRLDAEPKRRRHLVKLAQKLNLAPGVFLRGGTSRESTIQFVLRQVSEATHPLLEKFNVYRFYCAWSNGQGLVDAASGVRSDCADYINGTNGSQYAEAFEHFRDDMLAQLFRENKLAQRYLGFSTFVSMSDGLPRALLNILRYVYRWGSFNGESMFSPAAIAEASQVGGVAEASDWFFQECSVPGKDGLAMARGIGRLGNLLRLCRFADKPTEPSPLGFSVEFESLREEAQQVITMACARSLLIELPRGQRRRNDSGIDHKYRLNRMLAPHWDLPIRFKGTMALKPDEVNAIFDPAAEAEYRLVLRDYKSRLNAPNFGRRTRPDERQLSIPGVDGA